MRKNLFFGAILTMICFMFAPVVMALEVDTFEKLQNAVNANEKEITLTENVAGNLVVPAGSEITFDGGDKTLTGTIKFDAVISGDKATTVFELKNLVLDGNNANNIGIISMNQATDPVKLYLSMDNVTVQNFTGKGTYFTNVQELLVTNCKFNNNATTEQTNVVGDYAFDINLVGIQDAVIVIENSEFGGVSGGNSPVKVTQRGGVDDIMKDIPYYRDNKGENRTDKAAASIYYLSVSNNDFSKVTGNKKGDVIIGSSPNADGSARTSASDYSYEIVAAPESETKVYVRSTTEEEAKTNEYTAKVITSETPLRNGMVAVTISIEDESSTVYIPVGTKLSDEEIAELKAIKVDGYEILGYYGDKEFEKEFDFTAEFESDTTIYAKLQKIADTPVIDVENPSTGDINLTAIMLISLAGLAGISYSLITKLKMNKR